MDGQTDGLQESEGRTQYWVMDGPIDGWTVLLNFIHLSSALITVLQKKLYILLNTVQESTLPPE